MTGNGRVYHRGTIIGDVRLEITGNGRIEVAAVRGHVEKDVTGNGKIVVNGQTHRMRQRWGTTVRSDTRKSTGHH